MFKLKLLMYSCNIYCTPVAKEHLYKYHIDTLSQVKKNKKKYCHRYSVVYIYNNAKKPMRSEMSRCWWVVA